MDKFEQGLKEKMEGASYEYKNKYWSAFKRYSGMSMLSKGAWIALSSVGAAIIVAGGLFFGLGNHEPATEEITPNNETFSNSTIDNQIIAIDSSVNNEMNIASNTPSATPTTPQSNASQKNAAAAIVAKVDTQATAPHKTNVEKTKHQKNPIRINGHASVITVDSTVSNDFPDYETSTEPLP